MPRNIIAKIGFFSILAAVAAFPMPAAAADDAARTRDILAGIKPDPELASLVPANYKQGFVDVHLFDGAPLSFVMADGVATGIEVDLVRAISKLLDVNVTFQAAKLEALIPGLQAGRYQTASIGMTSTKAREALVDMTSYSKYGQGITVKKGSPEVKYATSCGVRVAVLNGTVQHNVLVPKISADCKAAGKEGVIINVFPDPSALFLAVMSGRVDAAMMNDATIAYFVDQSNGELVISDAGYSSERKAIMIGKDTGLSDAFLQALKKLYEDGTTAAILAAWGLKDVAVEPRLNAATAGE